MVGCCEQGNEPSSFIKSGKISKLSEDLLTSHEGRFFMELVC